MVSNGVFQSLLLLIFRISLLTAGALSRPSGSWICTIVTYMGTRVGEGGFCSSTDHVAFPLTALRGLQLQDVVSVFYNSPRCTLLSV